MQDRQINPDSFYEKESEETELLYCDECGDEILKNEVLFFKGGVPFCNYCKVHILKIK